MTSTARAHSLPLAEPGQTGQVTITDQGAGRPFLLLLHGGGPQTVAGFAELLATSPPARVITPTHPGFARAPRPAALASVAGLAALYVALLDDLDLSEVTQFSYYDPGKFRIDPATRPPAVQEAIPGNRASLATYAGTTFTDPGLAGRLAGIDVPPWWSATPNPGLIVKDRGCPDSHDASR
ncbi:MAG TPA: hypothetical protein VHY58_00335 [Streptosporangiaceae bacterium]|nr:hypothetical protein [Streptosporangiaceae bacterium]